MKLKYVIALLILSCVFMSPALHVMGSNLGIKQNSGENSDSETSDHSSEGTSTENKSGETGDKTNNESEQEKNHDVNKDGVDDGREKAEEREVQVEHDEGGTKVEMQSTLKLGESKNKIQFSIEADHKLDTSLRMSLQVLSQRWR